MLFQFSTTRLVEFADPQEFNLRAGEWMEQREAENYLLLGALPDLVAGKRDGATPQPRLLAVEDKGAVVAAAVLYPNGGLAATWATPKVKKVLIDGLLGANCRLTSIYAPGHVAWELAKLWMERTGQRFEFDRTERVYQLAQVRYVPPATGRLRLATPGDSNLLATWLEAFTREIEFENPHLVQARDAIIAQRQLYLWEDPDPVAMAAWVAPTPHGGCINLVYTPLKLRSRGHATALVAALGQHMLASGQRFCFIMTDPSDQKTNAIYQRVGAQALCELVRCKIVA